MCCREGIWLQPKASLSLSLSFFFQSAFIYQGQSLNTFFPFSLESEFLTLPISSSLVCLSGTESFGLFSCLVNGEEREQTHRAVFRYINSFAHGDPQPQPTDCLGQCCLWHA